MDMSRRPAALPAARRAGPRGSQAHQLIDARAPANCASSAYLYPASQPDRFECRGAGRSRQVHVGLGAQGLGLRAEGLGRWIHAARA